MSLGIKLLVASSVRTVFIADGDCKNLLETFKPSPEDGDALTKYQQWQSFEKKSEKVTQICEKRTSSYICKTDK